MTTHRARFQTRLACLAATALCLQPLSSFAQAFLTWTGSGDNWNNTSRWSNWDSGGFPYGQLQWTGGGSTTSNNNFSPANQWRLFFNGNTAYTITGNEIRLFDNGGSQGGIMSRASGNQVIEANVRFSDSGDRRAFIVTRMDGSGSGGGGGSLTLGNVEIAGGVTALNLSGEAGAGAITIAGTLSGSGKPIVIGRDHNNDVQIGTVVNLAGNNSYSGGTTLRSGVLRVGHNNALGTGALTVDDEGASARTLASMNASNFTLGNTVNLSNNLTLGQSSGGTGSLTLSGDVILGGTGSVRTLTVLGSHAITGDISGTLGILQQGAGTLELSGSNSFTGGLFIDSGHLRIGGGTLAGNTLHIGAGVQAQTGNAATLEISAPFTLSRNVDVRDFGTGAGNRTLVFSNTTGTATVAGNMLLEKTLDVQTDTLAAIQGNISGSGGLNLSGNGRLVLSGTNSYEGETIVNSGILVINGNHSAATGNITVSTGATLLGTGVIGGNTTIAGVHNPGNSPGVQVFGGDLSYTADAVFAWEIDYALDASGLGTRGTQFSGVNVGGDLGIASGAEFRVVTNQPIEFDGGPGQGFWGQNRVWANIFDVAGSTNGSLGDNLFVNVFDTDGNLLDISSVGTFTIEGTTLTYTAIPEPASLALAMILGLSAWGMARRRAKH